MSTKHIFKALVLASITTFSAQIAAADLTLKLGTTGRLGMPIGDAIAVSYTHLTLPTKA